MGGEYMLKGYKMLNDSCPNCLTIMLEDRSSRKFCVSCCDLDVDTAKDEPAFADIVREEVSSHPLQPQSHSSRPQEAAISPREGGLVQESSSLPSTVRVKVERAEPQEISSSTRHAVVAAASAAIAASADSSIDCDIECYIDTLNTKIRVTVEQLSQCGSDHRASQLSNIIKACTDAIINIHKLKALN